VEIKPTGQVIYRQRFWGGFSQPLELQDFPFDTQRLEISLIELGFGSADIRYKVFPGSGISDSMSIPDWEVLGWDFSPASLQLNKSSQVEAMVFSLEVKRLFSFFNLNVRRQLSCPVALTHRIPHY